MTRARDGILALLRVCAILAGLALFLNALSRMPVQDQAARFVFETEMTFEEGSSGISFSSGWYRYMPLQEYVLQSMSGAVILFAAILLWAPRFSLKRLLTVILCGGLAVALPLTLRPYQIQRYALVCVGFDRDYYKPPLTDDEVRSIAAALQPPVAKATLPGGFLAALNGRLEDVNVAVDRTSFEKDGRTYAGLSCELQMPATLDGQTAHGIFDFYRQYALRLAEARINGRGHTRKARIAGSGSVLWSKWGPEWQREYERTHPTDATPAASE